MAKHNELTDADLHVPGYVQAGDPGAVGAGVGWIDTSGGAGNWLWKIRNATDNGWEILVSAGGVTDFVDLDDTPVDYGTDGQALLTDGVGTVSWGNMTAGFPDNPEEYDVIDLQWSFLVFNGLIGTLQPSKASVVGSVIATGDGVTSEFNHLTSGYDPALWSVDPGSIAISVLLTNAATALITDDGEGNLADVANGISGSVTYYSGDWNLTFSGAVPANLADMTANFDSYRGSAVLRVTAYDIIRVIHGGWAPFQYGMRLSSPGEPDPAMYQVNSKDAYLEFTCGELGQNPIQVWLKDAAGNQIFKEIYIIVQDNLYQCF